MGRSLLVDRTSPRMKYEQCAISSICHTSCDDNDTPNEETTVGVSDRRRPPLSCFAPSACLPLSSQGHWLLAHRLPALVPRSPRHANERI